MIDADKAQDFITANIARYGLTGSLTTHNPDRGFPQYPAFNPIAYGTDFNRYGYSERDFGHRKSSTCVFWTDYAVHAVEETPFELALQNTIADLDEDFFVVICGGSPLEPVFVQNLLNAKKHVTQIVVEVDGHTAPHIPSIQHSKLIFTQAAVEELLRSFAAQVRGTNPIMALYAAAAKDVDCSVFFESIGLQLVDNFFDVSSNMELAQPYFSVSDTEERYSVYRFLSSQQKVAQASILRISPEFFTASLRSLYEAALNERRRRASYDLETFIVERLPNYLSKPLLGDFSFRKNIEDLMSDLICELTHKYDKNNESHLVPVHRLISGLSDNRIKNYFGVVS